MPLTDSWIMPIDIPPEAKEAAPGIIGALVAIPFTQGPLLMRSSMFLGGASLSLYGSAPLADALKMQIRKEADRAKAMAKSALASTPIRAIY